MTVSINKNQDFQLAYSKGKSFANKYLIMYVRENGLEYDRLGVSVSKKVGNSVVRHRIARLIRESYRLNVEKFHSGWDIVVIARTNAKDKCFNDIESAMLHLTKLHGILNS